jgi:chromosome segregation ATPase
MEQQVQQLEINLMKLTTDITYIKKSLDNNDNQHKEIIGKIDGLSETFTNKIKDKADYRETMEAMEKMSACFVPIEEFKPIKSIVYGMVGFILLAFLAGIVGLVVIK